LVQRSTTHATTIGSDRRGLVGVIHVIDLHHRLASTVSVVIDLPHRVGTPRLGARPTVE